MLARTPPVMTIQAEVLNNIRSERIGGHTVADLALPDAFLRRVADRIIRESFEGRFRLVVADSPGTVPEPSGAAAQTAPDQPPRIVPTELPASRLAYRASLREGRPERRNFRAPILERADLAPPTDLAAVEPAERAAADLIARGLARDGLLATLARAIEIIGPARFERVGDEELSLLERVGLPTDLLRWFSARFESGETVREVAAVVRAHGPRCTRELAKLRFGPSAACAGFRAAADSGQEPLEAVRTQATAGKHWLGPGDGGSLDLLTQMCGVLPDATITVSVERTHLEAFAAEAAAWPGAASRVTIIPEELPVSQWAQDNGKSGRDHEGNPVLLVPRYASRGEIGAVFVPGETFVADGLAAAGMRAVQSPLLFQGGNVVLVDEGPSGRRTLLVGEAEIWRNTALGLTKDQGAAAFCAEFGADRCVIMPAASFHLDFEVTLRTTPGGVLAFVADAPAAARLILDCGLGALAAGGGMSPQEVEAARSHLDQGRTAEGLSLIARALGNAAIGPGRFSESFAACFSTGPMDHGPSNLYRVLFALDLLSALTASPAQFPREPHVRAYLESFSRQEADRRILRRILTDAGYKTVPIPSLAEPARGLTALNGLHAPGRYLMPTYEGLFAPVDAAAAAGLTAALGPSIRIDRVRCSETQRRAGALRCAVSLIASRLKFGL